MACVDLFCGAGGLTHGLRSAGVPVVAGVDIDPACRFPYEANNAGAVFWESDISQLSGDEVRDWFGDADRRVLAGCAPCQPFSSYTRQRTIANKERWSLLCHFARLAEETQPHVVTMENVPKIERHDVFSDFVSKLRRLGFEVRHRVANCIDYGLPQRRRRIVLIASRIGVIEIPKGRANRAATVKDAIWGLPDIRDGEASESDPLHRAAGLSSLNRERIRASHPGGTWRDWPPELRAKCHLKATGSTYSSVYGRMSWDKPAPVLTTQFYSFGTGRYGHPEQDRAISLREGATLQGFPADYKFLEGKEKPSLSVLGRLIGNAVPCPLAEAIGSAIVKRTRRT